jgi:hypothetical protein
LIATPNRISGTTGESFAGLADKPLDLPSFECWLSLDHGRGGDRDDDWPPVALVAR